eukprot:365703-Chlamydomonas_euryale.AAC.7
MQRGHDGALPFTTSHARPPRTMTANMNPSDAAMMAPCPTTSHARTPRTMTANVNRSDAAMMASCPTTSRARTPRTITATMKPSDAVMMASCPTTSHARTPRTITANVNRSDAAMMVPGRVDTTPAGSEGHTCIPATAVAPRSAPSWSMKRAPPPPSSAGWKSSTTRPGRSASRALSSLQVKAEHGQGGRCKGGEGGQGPQSGSRATCW